LVFILGILLPFETTGRASLQAGAFHLCLLEKLFRTATACPERRAVRTGRNLRANAKSRKRAVVFNSGESVETGAETIARI
jgi:hypothetical protein